MTVYTHRATIDPSVAPKLVLLTLAGIDESEADHILAERQSHDRSDTAAMPLSIANAPALQGKIYTVVAKVTLGPKSYVKSAVIELSDSPQRYFVLA